MSQRKHADWLVLSRHWHRVCFLLWLHICVVVGHASVPQGRVMRGIDEATHTPSH